jgi:hypothetical protein
MTRGMGNKTITTETPGRAQPESLVVEASKELVELVKKHTGGSADCHLIVEGHGGQRVFVALAPRGSDRYDVTSVRHESEGTLELSKEEFRQIVNEPKRVSMEVHGDVELFLKGKGIYLAEQSGYPAHKLNEYSAAFIELSQFKDPKSDFDLLAGRFVEVKTERADGTERFYRGRIGQEGGTGAFVVLNRAGECSFKPASTKEEILSIHAYSPHAEFGGKESVIQSRERLADRSSFSASSFR